MSDIGLHYCSIIVRVFILSPLPLPIGNDNDTGLSRRHTITKEIVSFLFGFPELDENSQLIISQLQNFFEEIF